MEGLVEIVKGKVAAQIAEFNRKHGTRLDAAEVIEGVAVVARLLSKAGVRL